MGPGGDWVIQHIAAQHAKICFKTQASKRSILLLIFIVRNLWATIKNGANHCCDAFYWLVFYFMDSQQCQQMEKVSHWIKTFELSTQGSSLLMGFSFRLDRFIQSFIVFPVLEWTLLIRIYFLMLIFIHHFFLIKHFELKMHSTKKNKKSTGCFCFIGVLHWYIH